MKTKQLLVALLVAGSAVSAQAQTNLELNLNHKFETNDFQYGTIYQLEGRAVTLDRVQYYMSGFEITHDGGQTTAMPDTYVLGSANITNYSLGQETFTTLEGVSFDLGVDAARNGMGTSNWPAGHPLAAQSPTMDWGWPSGYFFWTIEGSVDDNGDGTPNKLFQLHGIGDHLLRDVDALNGMMLTGATVAIEIDVNIADWLKGINLESVGFSHDGGSNNVAFADNTNPESVFTISGTLGLQEMAQNESFIHADYTMAYAPTIYYDLATNDKVDISVVDMSGATVLEASEQNPEGNYFVRKELQDGVYLITFYNGEIREQFRFVVKN
mmetsp:Transcript_41478/g.54577  ORF Transcript_41478/g.54577 Transcript_41478/m.54577 type:complete len:326 (-) Transcript_41478:236-1213(-)